MSSLKDIMDVDVEPLESQAYVRAKEAAQQQASDHSHERPSTTPSPQLDDHVGRTHIKRHRSNRVSKPSGQASSSRPGIQRRSSSATEAMDFSSGYQAGGSNQPSASGSPPQSSSRGSEPATEVPLKYTPVTGRISRAKKGVPVHTCDICRPVKTFTRAEHLRRHKLSHQKPAYPCTFQDCERAFHRPDLLQRHLHRHETQGEGPHRSPAGYSRDGSSPSESRTPPLKVETPAQGDPNAGGNQISPSDSITPKTSADMGGSLPAYSFQSSHQHKRSASDAQLSGAGPFSGLSQASTRTSNFNQMGATFPQSSGMDFPLQNTFTQVQQTYGSGIYAEPDGPDFSNFNNTAPALPLLEIPEQGYIPSLVYQDNNSPWCSSASDSTYSTQSEGSRAPYWSRPRSASIHTAPDWTAQPSLYSPSNGIIGNTSDMRNTLYEHTLEQYEPHFTTSPRMTPQVPTRLLDMTNSMYTYIEPVGTPTTLSTYNKPTAHPFQASPSRISDAAIGGHDSQQKFDTPHQLGGTLNSVLALGPSYPPQSPQLDAYIRSYWEASDQITPIIHRATFDPAEDPLLTSAMAAIGTQYHDNVEDRERGIELNKYCRESIEHCLNWTLHTMQAILLTEMFTRFRGRRTTVHLTSQFENIYSRLLNIPEENQIASYANYSSGIVPSRNAFSLLGRFSNSQPPTPQRPQHPDLRSEWVHWANNEARQRLLNACFMFDVHQSIYQEQRRSSIHVDENETLLFLPCPDNLWKANCASEWQAQNTEYNVQPLHLIEQELTPQYLDSVSHFTRSLLTCSLARCLPTRTEPRQPNTYDTIPPQINILNNLLPNSPQAQTYLALHYTPLHDLLAVTGDTWIFNRKLTTPAAFDSARDRLKKWSSSPAAATATHHACRLLSLAYSHSYPSPSATGTSTIIIETSSHCISDYWALYVCALICWAFGHKHQHQHQPLPSKSTSTSIRTHSRSSSSTTASIHNDTDHTLPASPTPSSPSSPATPTSATADAALAYINGMLALSTSELLGGRAPVRGDTAGLIEVVRARLERENVGGKCMSLVDAVYVLGRIRQGGRGRAKFF